MVNAPANRSMWLLLAGLICLEACQLKRSALRAPLEDQGAAYVWLAATPESATGTAGRLTACEALREDGSTFPLELRPAARTLTPAQRHRLLASGPLPPGRYTALTLRFERPPEPEEAGGAGGADTHKAEPAPGDPSSSKPPDLSAEVRAPVPFNVAARRAVVLSLGIAPGSTPGSPPTIAGSIPGKIATGLIGIVSSREENVVTLFDKGTGGVVAVVPTGRAPSGVALDQTRHRAYVAIAGDDAIEVIDLLEGAVVDRLRLVGGDAPVELALTPDGATLLAVDEGANAVSIVDPSALFETARVGVGNGPCSILLDPDGRRAFVLNALSNSISVIDVAARAVVQTLATEAEPSRAQFDRAGRRIFVVHRSSPWLLVIDAVTLGVQRRVNVGSGVRALRIDPRTDRLYLAHGASDAIEVYDPVSFLPVDSIETRGDAAFLTLDAEERTLWVALTHPGRLEGIRLVGGRRLSETDVPQDPAGVALMGER